MALAVFLMQWNDATYRDAFLDFVRDAYRGRIKRSTGRSLEDRLGEPVRVIETQFRDFLCTGRPQSLSKRANRVTRRRTAGEP